MEMINILLFLIFENATELYFGGNKGEEITEFGLIGEETFWDEISVSKKHVFGLPTKWVSGVCGAMCALYYLARTGSQWALR